MRESEELIAEELSAYIDGELEPAARRQVEERLARDPDYAQQLRRLESAWNLLDGLPRATVNDQFASTTLQMAALSTGETATDEAVRVSSRRRGLRRDLALWVGGLAAGLAGLCVGRFVLPDPNEALLRDLPVIEHLDIYRQAESLEFARQLLDSGLFADEGETNG